MVWDPDLDRGFAARPVSVLRPWRTGMRPLVPLVFAVGCSFVLLCLLLPSSSHCDPKVMNRAQCTNNLKQIELALRTYHDLFDVLPPAYVADANGRPMHSWRVLILPFLEQSPLYNRYNFSEPWDGPNNIKLLDSMPTVFDCPSRYSKGAERNRTSYVAITGPGTLFPGTAPAKFADDADGLTMMVAEVENVNIPWTAPTDLDIRTMSFQINDPKRPGISSKHPRGANAIVHGSGCEFVQETMSAQYVRQKATANDGTLVIQDDTF
jgi:hypothetical protein